MVDILKMSETFDKVVDAAKAVTTEPVMKVVNQRLSNPFFLCFMSSWIICNWDRVLLLLFSFNHDIEQRIKIVKTLPSNSIFFGTDIAHAHTIWYPLIATVFFVVGAPFLSYCVDYIQNGVVNKKNRNDSARKQAEYDLKMDEINKRVKYENQEEQARLSEKAKTKMIDFNISSLEQQYSDLNEKIKTANDVIESNKENIILQNKSYDDVLQALSKVRDELEFKNNELKSLNGSIIAQQNRLDSIKKEIDSKVLPKQILGGFHGLNVPSGLSVASGLNGLNGVLGGTTNQNSFRGLDNHSEPQAGILSNAMTLYPDNKKK